MRSTLASLGSALMVIALLAGCTALAYARWTRPIAEADAALARGDYARALAEYRAGEARFDRFGPARQLFTSEYNRVVSNELWLLYKLERYDEAIDKAEHAPDGANPHFWSACAFYVKALAEQEPQTRLGWMTRAEEEFRRAVEASPADWDSKYDYELTTRLAAAMRKQPKTPPNQVLQLLRPQPKAGAKPPKRVG